MLLVQGTENGEMIGLSLSLCVAEILEGKVKLEDVSALRTNTRAASEMDWAYLTSHYCLAYWRRDPERALRIVRMLREAGRIQQPRLENPDHCHHTDQGIWVRETD
jgi:hypothetical protein